MLFNASYCILVFSYILSRARGCLDVFTLIFPFFPLSPSLWETARYRLKYCLKGPLNPKQPTNHMPGKDFNSSPLARFIEFFPRAILMVKCSGVSFYPKNVDNQLLQLCTARIALSDSVIRFAKVG